MDHPGRLVEQRAAVQDSAFRRFHANQWTVGEQHRLPPGAWQACADPTITIQPASRIFVGVDVGGERSASAVVWVTEDLRVDCAIYSGNEAVLACAAKVRDLAQEFRVVEVVLVLSCSSASVHTGPMSRRPKTLGIIGGIAPPSTIDYYRQLTSLYRERSGDDSWPSILINSVDGVSFFSLVSSGDPLPLIDFLVMELERLSAAGADVALLASNTPHAVFDEVAARAPMRLLSIVEAAADEAQARGFKTLGLLGARATMEGDFYPAVFDRRGLSLITPEPEERRLIDDRYFGELVRGSFPQRTREEISQIVDGLAARGAEAVVLGGTELPLLFRDSPLPRLPTLDTTAIHVARAVEEMLSL